MKKQNAKREARSKSDNVLSKPSGAGYCNPPEKHRYRPGQSGNPSGRPKKQPTAAEVARKKLQEKILVTRNGKTERITIAEAIMHSQAKKALEGDRYAAELLFKYADVKFADGSSDSDVFSTDDEALLARYAREFADSLDNDADDAAAEDHGDEVP